MKQISFWDKPKSILWKYDTELGIAYFCPNCKTFVCGGNRCEKCKSELNWDAPVEYKGKIRWN